jgi:hypothetical protein
MRDMLPFAGPRSLMQIGQCLRSGRSAGSWRMSRSDWSTLWTASCRSAVCMLLFLKSYSMIEGVANGHDEARKAQASRV